MNAQEEVKKFKLNLFDLERKKRKLENYVPCAYCGKTVYRNLYSRERSKNNFCNQQCNANFKHKLASKRRAKRKYNFVNSIKNYRQTAWGVSPRIASLLQEK